MDPPIRVRVRVRVGVRKLYFHQSGLGLGRVGARKDWGKEGLGLGRIGARKD